MIYSYSLDPAEILGVSATASLQEIREAYRAKTKIYHPDKGGDEWAFRVVAKAHELMCTARVAGRMAEDVRTASTPTTESSNPFGPIDPKSAQRQTGRREEADPEVPDERRIDVELLILRFENENPMMYLLEPSDHRNLSCSVNVAWPSNSVDAASLPSSRTEATLNAVQQAFDAATTSARAIAARSSVDEGHFAGWLTYSNVGRAEEGFKALRAALNAANFGVIRSVREVSIPRTWSDQGSAKRPTPGRS